MFWRRKKKGDYGHYKLGERIARGGMSSVYLAKNLEPDDIPETVAIKVLAPESRQQMEERYRIWHERSISKSTEEDIAERLNHPNIIQTYDYGEEDGEIYIVMEYFDGPTLREIYVQYRNVEGFNEDIFRAIFQASRGLDHLCRKGIVHRDISPKNMLVKRQMLRAGERGAVKIIDFGLAMTTGELRAVRYTDKVGTVGYRAPEQFSKRSIDERVDVYAFGATMYELATGQQPFHSGSHREAQMQQQRSNIPSPCRIDPDVPDDLGDVIMKCLAPSKEDRPSDLSVVHTNLLGIKYRLGVK